MPSIWTRILSASADALFPPRCRACGALNPPDPNRREPAEAPGADPMAGEFARLFSGLLCPECLAGFDPVRLPVCSRCGLMLAGRPEQGHLCGECLQDPPVFSKARAAGVCGGVLLSLLHRFKYSGCVELARPLAGLMSAAFRRHFAESGIDGVVAVPLHPKRMRSRGFNQAELLVRSWDPPAPAPMVAGALIRTRPTAAQAGLGRKARQSNIGGAFCAAPAADLSGMRLLLVDDVYTTGATICECSRVLSGAGAESIDVLTLARAM